MLSPCSVNSGFQSQTHLHPGSATSESGSHRLGTSTTFTLDSSNSYNVAVHGEQKISWPDMGDTRVAPSDEEICTLNRLVLRNRSTAPYQLKFPFMTNRLSVPKGGWRNVPTSMSEDPEKPLNPVEPIAEPPVPIALAALCAEASSRTGAAHSPVDVTVHQSEPATTAVKPLNGTYDRDEEVRSIRPLVMRKRKSSPYQIKLPYMTERLRASHPKAPKRIPATQPTKRDQEANSGPNVSEPIPPPSLAEPPVVAGTAVHDSIIQTANSLKAAADECATAVSGSGVPPHVFTDGELKEGGGISASDTWADISADLGCAREILAFLSDLARSPLTSASRLSELVEESNLHSPTFPLFMPDPIWGRVVA
ncbi:hypothetical protein C8Q74DRAFT_769765 [Fomes fomentarius]|nr:hypothetical protein C8Q74DRAFT_769765 [Fomes fomentarius]